MKKDNLDHIMFAIEQVHEALKFGFTLNHCCRNLNIVITQYWEKQTLGLSVQDKPSLPKSKEAKKQFKETGKLEGCIAEHAIPKNIVVKKLLEQGNKKDVEKVLREGIHLLVITKEEDDKLRKAKLFKNMPDDWDGKDPYARYKKVGIELCDCEEPSPTRKPARRKEKPILESADTETNTRRPARRRTMTDSKLQVTKKQKAEDGYLMFTIRQAKEAVEYGFTVNNCRRNLLQVIKPYVKNKYKGFPISQITDELMDGPLEKEFVEETLTEKRIAEIASELPKKRNHARTSKDSFGFIIFALKQLQEAREKFPNQSQTENFTIAMVQHWEKEIMLENVQRKTELTLKSLGAQTKLDEWQEGDCIATHAIPMNIMIDCLLDKLPSESKIRKFLETNHHVVLITKDERDKLQGKEMPASWKCGDDPWAKYKKAKIKLVSGYTS